MASIMKRLLGSKEKKDAAPPLPPQPPMPARRLGRTGHDAALFGLGGEGVLRTHGRDREAAAVIARALDQGVNYCDTAPAYAGSMDYYGATLGERRAQVFLASKTHDRTRDGSLRLLDEMLKRLRTDRLDLWQLHDLREMDELDEIFGKGGALEALLRAKEEGRVRWFGITGHHDPAVLMEAMRRYDFDTVLVALNAADVHRDSFRKTVLPEAARRGMGVIAMKTCAQGGLLGPGKLSMGECLGYAWSLPGVTHAIVGCSTPAEVDENAALARSFQPFDDARMKKIEAGTKPYADEGCYYKK
ncbi:MAG: aldo/keto reductase [Planctomycetota bacterium]|nr:aldo/keto reductase [Planctomycetota bacterium]